MDFRPDLDLVRRVLNDPRTRHTPVIRRAEKQIKSSKNSPAVSSTKSTDRIGMLLMEANEIIQYLKKDYTFKKADESLDDDTVTFVKVIDVNRSCLWPLSKLKEKLVKMRKLVYAHDDLECQGTTIDALLFDGSDSWLPITYPPTSEQVSATASSFQSVLSSTMDSSVAHTSFNTKKSQPAMLPSNRSMSSSKDTLLLSDLGELDAETQFMFMPLSSSNHVFNDREYVVGSPIPDTDDSPSINNVDHIVRSHSKAAPRIKDPIEVDRPVRNSSAKSVRTSSLKAAAPTVEAVHHETRCAVTQTESSLISSRTVETQTSQDYSSLSNVSVSLSIATQTSNNTDCNSAESVIKACKETTSMLLARLSVSSTSHASCHLVDKLLRLGESFKCGIDFVLHKFTNTESAPVSNGFTQNYKLEAVCVQLVLTVELMITSIDVWSSQLSSSHLAYLLLSDIHRSLVQLVKELAKDLEILWQGCDSKLEVLIKESSAKIFALLAEIATELGKMSAVLGLCPVTLADCKRKTLEHRLMQRAARSDDLFGLEPGVRSKQAFLIGCDIMVDKTLIDCQQALDESETILQSLAEQFISSNERAVKQEVLKLVFGVVVKCKMLLTHMQQIQVALDTAIKDGNEKPQNYHHYYFVRCVAVISVAHKVADSVKLLTRTVESFHTEVLDDSLKKISRCSEMVQRTARRFSVNQLKTSGCGASRHSMDLSSVSPDDSQNIPYGSYCSATTYCEVDVILQPTQVESIQYAVESVTQATAELCNVVRKKLSRQEAISESNSLTASTSEHNIKRMLPVVPGSFVDGGVVTSPRCQSARCSDRRLSMLTKHISLLGFQSKKSNEI